MFSPEPTANASSAPPAAAAVAEHRPEPEPAPAPPAAPAPAAPSAAISREDLRKLQASLHELNECRRLLDSVLAEEG